MAEKIYDLSGSGGLITNNFGDKTRNQQDLNLRYIGGDGQFVDGIFNPFKKEGYLSPANQSYVRITPTGNQTNYGSTPRGFLQYKRLVAGDPDETYLIAGERLWVATGDNFTTFTSDATDVNNGSNIWPTDIETYFFENGATPLVCFLSDEAAFTDGRLRAYRPITDIYDGLMIGLTLDEYSSLVVADNGFLYILADTRVHKYDGTPVSGTGLRTTNVLQFPSAYRTRGGIDYRGNLFIGIVGNEKEGLNYRSGSIRNNDLTTSTNPHLCGVYVWDRLSTQVRMRDFIQFPNMRNLTGFHISPMGTLRVFGLTNYRTTQLLEFAGSTGGFRVIREFGPRAYPAQPKGVGISNNVTYWLGQDGFLHALGKVSFDKPEIYTKLLDVNAVSAAISGTSTDVMTQAGAILCTAFQNTGQSNTANRIDHEAILIGFTRTGSNHEVIRYFPHTSEVLQSVTPVANQGNIYTKVDYFKKLSTIHNLTMYCAPTATGSNVIATVKLYINQQTTPFMTKDITRDMASKGYITLELNKPYVNAFQIEIEYPTNHTLGTNDFSPSLAILDHTETSTIR